MRKKLVMTRKNAVFAVTCVVDGYTSIVPVYQKSMKIQNGSATNVWLLCLHDNMTVVTKECRKCSNYSCNDSMISLKYWGGGGGVGTVQTCLLGGSTPRSNPLPFKYL